MSLILRSATTAQPSYEPCVCSGLQVYALVKNILRIPVGRGLQDDDKKVVAIRDLNQRLMEDDRITLSIVPVGDGIAICRRR